jgi:hypothetical protein
MRTSARSWIGLASAVAVATGCVDLGALEGNVSPDGGHSDATGADASPDQDGAGEGSSARDAAPDASQCGTGSVPAVGATAVVARDTEKGPGAVVAFGGYVFWTNGNSLHSADEDSRTSSSAAPGTCVRPPPPPAPRPIDGLYVDSSNDDIVMFGPGLPTSGGSDCCTFYGSLGSNMGTCGVVTSESCLGWANDGTSTFLAVTPTASSTMDTLYSEPIAMSVTLLMSTPLGTGTALLPAMAANNGTLYYATEGGTIYSIVNEGAPPQTVAMGQMGIVAMAVNDSHLFWLLSTGAVESIATSDTPVEPTLFEILGGPVGPGASMFLGEFALYVTNGTDTVFEKGLDDSSMVPQIKIGGQAQPRGVYVDTMTNPKSVYWANYGNGTIMVTGAE